MVRDRQVLFWEWISSVSKRSYMRVHRHHLLLGGEVKVLIQSSSLRGEWDASLDGARSRSYFWLHSLVNSWILHVLRGMFEPAFCYLLVTNRSWIVFIISILLILNHLYRFKNPHWASHILSVLISLLQSGLTFEHALTLLITLK